MGECPTDLEAEAQHTPWISHEGIKIENGEGVNIENRVVTLIEESPKYLSVNRKGDTMEWIRECHCCYQQEKGQLQKDQ